eukprot:SAG11_NODE_16644_length_541_cov_1.588235_1_plen_25_part_10
MCVCVRICIPEYQVELERTITILKL